MIHCEICSKDGESMNKAELDLVNKLIEEKKYLKKRLKKEEYLSYYRLCCMLGDPCDIPKKYIKEFDEIHSFL